MRPRRCGSPPARELLLVCLSSFEHQRKQVPGILTVERMLHFSQCPMWMRLHKSGNVAPRGILIGDVVRLVPCLYSFNPMAGRAQSCYTRSSSRHVPRVSPAALRPNIHLAFSPVHAEVVLRGRVLEIDRERRRGPRYLFIADTEVTDMVADSKGSGRTSELSISGCFIDTANPAPAGTKLRVRISQQNTTFTALGCVMSVIPNTGMSIAFTSIEPHQLSVLQNWLPER